MWICAGASAVGSMPHCEAGVADDDWVLGLLGGKAIEVHMAHSLQL